MRNADEANPGRVLARARWTPEARLRSGLAAVKEHAAYLDEAQRDELREIADQAEDVGGHDDG